MKNIKLMIFIFATIILTASAVKGFESEEYPTVLKTWGHSVRQMKERQIANPDAGKVTGPIEGLDGKAVRKAMDAYHESFSLENTSKKGFSLDSISIISGGGNK